LTFIPVVEKSQKKSGKGKVRKGKVQKEKSGHIWKETPRNAKTGTQKSQDEKPKKPRQAHLILILQLATVFAIVHDPSPV